MAKLTGEVVSVTAVGDLVTDISVADLVSVPHDEQVTIRCDGHATSGIFPADHDQPAMTFIAVEGESGFLELALVGDDASRFLNQQLEYAYTPVATSAGAALVRVYKKRN